MKSVISLFNNLLTEAKSEKSKIRNEWDKQRLRAMSPSELSEIDAIFARHL